LQEPLKEIAKELKLSNDKEKDKVKEKYFKDLKEDFK
tara:strand:- start:139 stop:249 length:111 start_codon:yes stop_codon:yes gene_type:complete